MSQTDQETGSRTDRKPPDSIADAAEQAASTISEDLNKAVRATKQAVGQGGDAVGDRFDELKGTARGSYNHGKEAALQYKASTEAYGHERPLKALAIANAQ